MSRATVPTLCATICAAGVVYMLATEGPTAGAAFVTLNFIVWAYLAWARGEP